MRQSPIFLNPRGFPQFIDVRHKYLYLSISWLVVIVIVWNINIDLTPIFPSSVNFYQDMVKKGPNISVILREI